MNAAASLQISRGPLRIALSVFVCPAALARQLEAGTDPEEFRAWADAALPPALVACEKELAQAAERFQSGLLSAWTESLRKQAADLQESSGGGAA